MQPVVIPTNAMIKAMGDLCGVLKRSANKVGMAEMKVLKQLDAILSGPVEIGTQKPKHITFAASTALEKPIAPLHEQDTASPRVTETSPRVISAAVVDKPYGPPQPMMARVRAKAQQVALSGQQRWTTNCCCNTDFQAAISVMEYNLTSEMAHAPFDKESGKMLKYRKLITHRKYREAWMHSSANEFGWLAQGFWHSNHGHRYNFLHHQAGHSCRLMARRDKWQICV
jgi:hypothetical protein